jgi:eIF-2B alpha/beta/delta-like uncharacterized protein
MEDKLEKIIKDIKDLKIQGNTNIAKAAAKGLLDYITHAKPEKFADFIQKVKNYCHELGNARPNEALTNNAMMFITRDIEECDTPQQVRIKVIERIENYFQYLDESFEIIRTNAVNLLKGNKTFMTDCHSSLVRDSLLRIHELNPDIQVLTAETRPLYQGRITATKLAEKGVDVIQIIDSAVSSFILDHRYPTPDVIIVGSDGITMDGGLINKVGTYNLAIAAKKAGIPFYALSQTMKLDLRTANIDEYVIEQRAEDEVWAERPEGVRIINPAFDLIPAEYLTGGFITEKGLLTPEEIGDMVKIGE